MYMDLNESGRLCWPAVAGRELRPINRSFLLLWSNTIDSIDTNANKNKKNRKSQARSRGQTCCGRACEIIKSGECIHN
jgi:hypothetical protein